MSFSNQHFLNRSSATSLGVRLGVAATAMLVALLAIPVGAQTIESTASTRINEIREAAVTTNPCDPAPPDSPCKGQPGNRLPIMTYSADLAQSAQAFSGTCPLQHSTFPDGENLYLSRTAGQTDLQLLNAAFDAWTNPRGYDPLTGTCTGTCRYYAQMINGATEVGCAVTTTPCALAHVVCHFNKAWIPDTPAYPVSLCDPDTPGAIIGTSGDDGLIGTPDDDVIIGLEGNDVIVGQGGNDCIAGGIGDDRIIAGAGNDEVDGGPGNDRIVGARGNDRILAGEGNDTVVAGSGDDAVEGGQGDDRIFGGSGNDDLDGGSDNDLTIGGSGTDTCVNGELVLQCE